MTQDMTEMILGERDIECEIQQPSRQGVGKEQAIVWLEYAIMLVLMLVWGTTSAWGQSPKVADGVYYIRNNATNKGYLWPSVTTNTTTGYRYLTTSLGVSASEVNNNNNVSYPAHDKSYSHWVVKNVTGGYIQLINPRLNKYVVIRAFSKANNTKANDYGDRDVWLTDEPASENLGYSYFVLNNDNSPYKISPKPELNGKNTTTGYSLNSASGDDRTWLTWSKSDNKPQKGEGREGLIQFYSGGTPLWSFTLDLLDAPTISDVDENSQVTITENNELPSGYNIRYTTDGSDPTASSTILEGNTLEISSSCTLKMVIERYGVVLTGVATKAVIPVAPKPTFTLNADGSITMTSEAGTTIRYTTDGSDPNTSSTSYSTTPIDASVVANATGSAIKAIAVNDADNTIVSYVVTIPLQTYTYKIVNKSKVVVLKKVVKQAVGKSLSTYIDIPADIRSSYLRGETMTFYGAFAYSYDVGDGIPAETIAAADQIDRTPESGTDIYVTYDFDNSGDNYLHLQGARTMNIKYEVSTGTYNYLKNDNGTIAYDPDAATSITATTHLWYIGSATATADPYAVVVQNSTKNNYLKYTSSPSPAFSLGGEADIYYIVANTPVDTDSDGTSDYEDVTLKNISSGESYTIRVFEVKIPTSYYMIDKAGKKLFGPLESTSSTLSVPSEWQSPLVSTYHFWKESAFDPTKLASDTYELIKDPAPTEMRNEDIPLLGAGEHIYITYDVDPTFEFDNTDDDKTGSQTYMLRFTGGEYFRQEDGHDAMMAEDKAQKAVYPYSNGDAMLYVYGTEQWNTQLNSGASTRTRWLWYVVSPTSDPYHVYIMSHQGQASSHSYFRTYPVTYQDRTLATPANVTKIVTGVTTKNKAAKDAHEDPTEYMILKTLNGNCKLVTVNSIFDGENSAQRTVTNFEQYWKNNPTVQNLLKEGTDNSINTAESFSDNIQLDATQTAKLPDNWHSYKAFANAAPWHEWKTDSTGTGKKYIDKDHWFQTIDMGSTGEFVFEPVTLQPQVILIDNHGWEVMRMAMYSDKEMTVKNVDLKKYDSPMVKQYRWYPTASKANGYHKYTVKNPNIAIYNKNASNKWVATTDSVTHQSTSLYDVPYDHITPVQDKSVKSDFYVTYDVQSLYANSYAGAATSEASQASKFVVKQGSDYAKNNGNTLATSSGAVDVENVDPTLQWYVKPNFDIDGEMGYDYEGEYEEKTKTETDEDNFNAGMNGFDPYNVQLQSVSNTARYLATNSGSPTLSNVWEGSSTGLTLIDLSTSTKYHPMGYDQTTLNVTNTTFMVVSDANGKMLLMPRFDNTKVVNTFTSPYLKATADEGQYLTLEMVPTIVEKASDIKSAGGYFILKDGFDIDVSIGTAEAPFTGIIDGKLRTISSPSTALVAYADSAIIKNVIVDNVIISGDTVGAICNVAKGQTRIYNCGVLATNSTHAKDKDGYDKITECSSTIGGTNYAGGIVGFLDDDSRVINCYSYANITGGAEVGGIVGHNDYA